MVSISEIRLDMQTFAFLPGGEPGVPLRPPPCWTGETPVLHRRTHYAVAVLAASSDRELDLRHDTLQVLEGLVDGQRIHFATQAFTGFQRRFQKMAGDFLRQGVCDQLPGALLVFNPGRVRQGAPDRATVNQQLNAPSTALAWCRPL